MYLTYDEYISLGYSEVSEQEFKRFEIMARKQVDKYTFNRVTAENITDDNKQGMCEIIDIFKKDIETQDGELVSFSNNGYSESYSGASQEQTASDKNMNIIYSYFTQEQLYRGI